MRRYLVILRGDFKKSESFTDLTDAVKTARRWKACYDGSVTITDNMTGKTEAV